MPTFSYETEGALQGRLVGVMGSHGLKGRGRGEQYYPLIVLFISRFYLHLHNSGQKMKKG